MHNPKFSVILPVYMVEKYLVQCIDSIRMQKYKNYELLAVVDETSADGCEKIVDAYCLQDSRIRKIMRAHFGLGDARNRGLVEAEGEFVLFIDSDDYLDNDRYFTAVARCIEKRKPDYIITGYKKYNESAHKIVKAVSWGRDACRSGSSKDAVIRVLDSGNFNVSAWSKAVRRSLIEENHLRFDRGYGEDIEWTGKILNLTDRIEVLSTSAYIYRMRPDSLSKTDNIQCVIDTKKRLSAWESALKGCDEYSDAQRGMMAYFYFINLAYIRGLPKSDRNKAYREIGDLKYLRKYARSKKARMAKAAAVFLGGRIGGILLHKYVKAGVH